MKRWIAASVLTLVFPILVCAQQQIPIVSGGVTIPAAAGSYRVILNQNVTSVAFGTPSGPIAGPVIVIFGQDATGGRTVSGYASSISGASQIVIAAAANALTLVQFVYDSSSNQWVVAGGGGGGGGGAVFQVNGANTTSQTPISLTNGTNITFSNPSLGNIEASLSGVIAASACPIATQSTPGCLPSLESPIIHTSSYPLAQADLEAAVYFNCSVSCTATLPSPALANGFTAAIINIGTAPTTISIGGTLTFNGGATAPGPLLQGQSAYVSSDGTNYEGAGPAKAGTDMTLAGSPTGVAINFTGQLPAGGANAVQFYSTASTFGGDTAHFDYNPATYALTLAGALSAGSLTASGNTAGCSEFNAAGSANYVQLCAPTTLTSNTTWALPAADGANGALLGTNGAGALSWITSPFFGVDGTATAVAFKIGNPQLGYPTLIGNSSAGSVDGVPDNLFGITGSGLEVAVDASGDLGLYGSLFTKWSIVSGTHFDTARANSDVSGVIAVSAGTSASVTFATAYGSVPACVLTPTSNPGTLTWWVTTTTTAFTANLSAAGTVSFNYVCMGNPT